MELVVLESPYAGNIDLNITYARACVRDSLGKGEAPIASHLLYTQEGILKDEVPEERQWGIQAGLAWGKAANKAVFYIDLGMSDGMKQALRRHLLNGTPVEMRSLPKDILFEIVGKSVCSNN